MSRNESDEKGIDPAQVDSSAVPEWEMPEETKKNLVPDCSVEELLAAFARSGRPLLPEVRKRYFDRLYPLRDESLYKLQSLTFAEIASTLADALWPLLDELSPQLRQKYFERAVGLWRLPTLFESHFTYEFMKWVYEVEHEKRKTESERQRLMSVNWAACLQRFGFLKWSGDPSHPYTWLGSNLYMLYDVWQVLNSCGAMIMDFNTFCSCFLSPDGSDFPADKSQQIRKKATDKDRSRRYLPPEIESALRDV